MNPAAIVVATLFAARALGAQAVLAGTVREDSGRVAVVDAEVLVQSAGLGARTDSSGRFLLRGIPPGRHEILVRRVGFDATRHVMTFSQGDSLSHDFDLRRNAQPLPEVPVTGASTPLVSAKLRGFEDRRKMGIGHFITEANLARDVNRRVSDVLSKVPGVRMVYNNTSLAAFVFNTRGMQSISGTARIRLPDGRTIPYCPAAVYLDGVPVYRGNAGEPPFDVNSIQVSEIAAIEYYAGGAQMPIEFNATRGTCGALLIWTK